MERFLKIRSTLTSAVVLGLTISFAQAPLAQGNSGKSKDLKVNVKPGKGPKAIPPGQIKRYTRGAKLPGDLKYSDFNDWAKWNLKAPGKGNRYIVVDNELLEVKDDISTVVDTIGIIDDLLK